MKNKKCPNCLCDVDLRATSCPFCKTAIKQTKLLTSQGFKAPQVVAHDIKPLHNTKVTAQLPELPKKENPEEVILEIEEKKEKEPYVPKILDIKNLPQNNELFVDSEETQQEIISVEEMETVTNSNPIREFDFDGELMQEIKAYFDMPSPNLNEYEQKHLEIIDNMSIDDIIQGSLEANKKEKKQESFGLMFGGEENVELPSYKDIANNNIESSDKVKKIYDKVVESKDYNSFMHDTLDTSLDALGFADEKLGFGDLKKKLEAPEPTIQSLSHNIVENLNIKLPKLKRDNTLNEEVLNQKNTEQSLNSFSNPVEENNQELKNLNFKFDQDKKIDISTTVNIPSFVKDMSGEVQEKEESIDKINNQVKNVPDNEIYELLKNRADLFTTDLNKEDPYHRDPFEIDNIEIAEIKDYFKEEKDQEIVKASEINVDLDVLKELNEFAGVNPEDGFIEEEANQIEEVMENTKPVFQSKNILRVSDESIIEKESNIIPAKNIREAVFELESLKNEFLNQDTKDNLEEPTENGLEESTISSIPDLNNWFSNEELESLNNKSDEKIEFANNQDKYILSGLSEDEVTSIEEEAKSDDEIFLLEETGKTENEDENLQSEEIDIEFNIPLFSDNDTLESLQPLENNNFEHVSLKGLIDDLDDDKKPGIFDLANTDVFHELKEDNSNINSEDDNLELSIGVVEGLEIPESILELTENPILDSELEQEKELKSESFKEEFEDINTTEILEDRDNYEELENIEIPESILILTENPILNSEPEQEKELKLHDIEHEAQVTKQNEESDLKNINTDNVIESSESDIETEEIIVPEFLNDINIEIPRVEEIIANPILEESPKISTKISLNRLKNLNENIKSEFTEIKEEERKIPPPPPPPPFVEVKQIKEEVITENFNIPIIPKFDDETPKIRNPITTTLNTTLGARSTTNQEAMDYYISARDLCLKKQYSQALDELEKAVTLDPAFEQAHILLSRTYLKIKNVY